MNLRTYADWALDGRAIIKGQKAEHYLVSPDRSEGYAAFREDQTTPITAAITEGWDIVPAEDWKAERAASKPGRRPKVIVDYHEPTKTTLVWCGNNKSVIRVLQKNNYHFDMRSHRWTKPSSDTDKTVAGLESLGLEVELGPGMPGSI